MPNNRWFWGARNRWSHRTTSDFLKYLWPDFEISFLSKENPLISVSLPYEKSCQRSYSILQVVVSEQNLHVPANAETRCFHFDCFLQPLVITLYCLACSVTSIMQTTGNTMMRFVFSTEITQFAFVSAIFHAATMPVDEDRLSSDPLWPCGPNEQDGAKVQKYDHDFHVAALWG